MSARPHSDAWRPETVLLIPFVLVLIGLLAYFLVELLPTVRVLPG